MERGNIEIRNGKPSEVPYTDPDVHLVTNVDNGAFSRIINHPTDPNLVTVEYGFYDTIKESFLISRNELLAVLLSGRPK